MAARTMPAPCVETVISRRSLPRVVRTSAALSSSAATGAGSDFFQVADVTPSASAAGAVWSASGAAKAVSAGRAGASAFSTAAGAGLALGGKILEMNFRSSVG